MRKILVGSVVATTCLLAACGGGSGGSDGDSGDTGVRSFNASPVVNQATDSIVNTYSNLNQAAIALNLAVTELQADGATEQELLDAQAAWKEARSHWEASEGFLFGPVGEEGLAIDPAIDSWPLNIADLTAFMQTQPDQAAVDNASDEVKGFHAMEWILFGNGVESNTRAADSLSADELSYLIALSGSFQGQTAQLLSAWTTDYNGNGAYLDTFRSSNPSAAMEQLVDAMTGIADEVGAGKIAGPFGNSIDQADTTAVESPFSWNSLNDFYNNIQSIMNIYTGILGSDGQNVSVNQNGVYAFVVSHDAVLADKVLSQILQAQMRIALIKGDGDASTTEIGDGAAPFRNQILNAEGRVLIQDAMDAILVLRDTLDTEVKPLIKNTQF